MNKNNINFHVHRTKEGTICEIACTLLLLISLVLSIALFTMTTAGGSAMLIQTISVAFGVALILVLAYHPKTFNIADDSPAETFMATVRFIRIAAVLMSLLSVGITLTGFFAINPGIISGAFGLCFVPLLCWYLYTCRIAKRQQSNKKP